MLLRPTDQSILQRRPRGLPRYWRNVSGVRGLAGQAQRREWILVLSACAIPHLLIRSSGREYLYVPPMLEQKARRELAGFDNERGRARFIPEMRPVGSFWPAVLLVAMLYVWHGLRSGRPAFPPCLHPAADLLEAGSLDAVRVHVYGEYYRAATALTLHADDHHLWSNMAFGTLSLWLLARLAGTGSAMLLTVAGGICGNALTVFLRQQPVVSLGFSTAVFAAIGSMSGIMAFREKAGKARALFPLLAGFALLAMLGAEGVKTDYAAHVAGLVCGMALGLLEEMRHDAGLPGLREGTAAAVAIALPALAWCIALRHAV